MSAASATAASGDNAEKLNRSPPGKQRPLLPGEKQKKSADSSLKMAEDRESSDDPADADTLSPERKNDSTSPEKCGETARAGSAPAKKMENSVSDASPANVKAATMLKPSPSLVNLDQSFDPIVSPSPTGSSRTNGHQGFENGSAMMEEAWEMLKRSYVYFKGNPVGTLAALDSSGTEALNYNQVFVRDFFPAGLACLMKSPPEPKIVKNFLLKTLHLQGSYEKKVDRFTLASGVMPASFKVEKQAHRRKDMISVDFGDIAIGRVAPVDSGFWWIILLRSYTKCTRDHALVERPEVQRGMKLILNLCLSDGFDTFPTLLCADGCSMIDRRMGIYGYPIEIQALFFCALRSAQQMLKPEGGGKELLEKIEKRISA